MALGKHFFQLHSYLGWYGQNTDCILAQNEDDAIEYCELAGIERNHTYYYAIVDNGDLIALYGANGLHEDSLAACVYTTKTTRPRKTKHMKPEFKTWRDIGNVEEFWGIEK